MTPAILDRWQAAFDARIPATTEPDWLQRSRRAALGRFRDLGFPTRRHEAWRYTDVTPIARTAWALAPCDEAATLERARETLEGLRYPATGGSPLVLVNGRVTAGLTPSNELPDGVRARTLAESLQGLETDLGTVLSTKDHAFHALNAALFPDALVVEIDDDCVVQDPLHVVVLSIGGAEPAAAHPRLFVRAGNRSRASVIVSWAGASAGPFLSNAVVEVRVAEGARLDWLDVQRQPPSVHHVLGVGVDLGRGSVFAATCLQLGGGVVRTDLETRLGQEEAACRLDGVTLGGGSQHVDVRTNVDHAVPHGTSEQLWKSILDGHASTAFAGRVLVRPGAQKTNARQGSHSLLLSRSAVADSVPQLEIFADDVKCAHGATVGQMDEDALFYLRSRGLGVEQARGMLIRAFADEVADRIAPPALATHAHAVLGEALDRWEGRPV